MWVVRGRVPGRGSIKPSSPGPEVMLKYIEKRPRKASKGEGGGDAFGEEMSVTARRTFSALVRLWVLLSEMGASAGF